MSDSWIWALGDSDKVQIDTFTAMQHQIKSPYRDSRLVHEVIRELKGRYTVNMFSEPKHEEHEDEDVCNNTMHEKN